MKAVGVLAHIKTWITNEQLSGSLGAHATDATETPGLHAIYHNLNGLAICHDAAVVPVIIVVVPAPVARKPLAERQTPSSYWCAAWQPTHR